MPPLFESLRPSMPSSAFQAALLVSAVHAVLWIACNFPEAEVPFEGRVRAFSYSPFRMGADPLAGEAPRPEVMSADLAQLSDLGDEVRTYSSAGGQAALVALAAEHGLSVTAGAWLGPVAAENEIEIDALLAAASAPNVRRLIVGNEALLRGDVAPEALAAYLDRARASGKPVSTAETWNTWLKHPELADHADFIAVHILPYWEGVDVDRAVDFTLGRLLELQARFPGKPVVITEIGWPSQGATFRDAVPGPAEQARFLRRFLVAAHARGLDYTLMEAYDQPWKQALEGRVGAHWGLWDAQGQRKLSLVAPLVSWPGWPLGLLCASLLALPLFALQRRRSNWRFAGHLVMATLIQGLAAHVVIGVHALSTAYLTPGGVAALVLLLALQALLLACVLTEGYQFVDLRFARWRRRAFEPEPSRRFELSASKAMPKVSLHLAICREPPALVIATLESLARLDYPDFEVLVVDNNTAEADLWHPVERRCAELGARFRFFHLETWPGFKAGALNFALEHTASDAEVVGVVDADYVVSPDWLRALVPHFARPSVGLVQAPQDHRALAGSAFKTGCNWEYAGFFQLGMVHRNEDDAIVQHGTMTLVRCSALRALGGWGEWCICEDAELGLRLLASGHESVYVPQTFGRGLTPDSFTAFKKQRFRWAYGAMQILKRHGADLLSGGGLSRAQRYHFVAGWLPWICDALSVVLVYASLLWSVGFLIRPDVFSAPLAGFVAPALVVLGLKMTASWLLYARLVPCSWRERVGASVAALALSHTIGKAVLLGLVTRRLPFIRTPKCEAQPALLRGLSMAGEEAALAVLLVTSAVAVDRAAGADLPDVRLWAVLLVAQALPYAAAVLTSLVNALEPALPDWRRAPQLSLHAGPSGPDTRARGATPSLDGELEPRSLSR